MAEIFEGANGFHRAQLHLNDHVSLETLGFFRVPRDWPGIEQAHTYWELHFFRTGAGRFLYNGRWHDYGAGQPYLIPPFVRHRFVNADPGECLYFGFAFHLSAARAGVGEEHCPLVHRLPEVAAMSGQLTAITAALAASDRNLHAARREVLRLLPDLLLALTRRDDEAADVKRERVVKLCNRVKAYLGERPHETISVESVARHFGLSPHYLGNLFRKVTGSTLKEYHLGLRMARAATLLKDPELTISQVADLLGFSTVHYFSKSFAAYFKIPPSKWR